MDAANLLALEFPVAFLATLVWSQLLIGAVEALEYSKVKIRIKLRKCLFDCMSPGGSR